MVVGVTLDRGFESHPPRQIDRLQSEDGRFFNPGPEPIEGERLEEVCETSAGDFLYIPPGLIHCAVNETAEPAVGVIARTPANEIITEYKISLPAL